MIIKLNIVCNDNPVPYKRTTFKQKFVDKKYQKYVQFKNYVYAEFVKQTNKYPHQIFNDKQKIRLSLKIFYKDKRHGDSDNIFKGIADAIFQKPLTDKYVCGDFDFFYSKENPRIEIEIEIKDRF